MGPEPIIVLALRGQRQEGNLKFEASRVLHSATWPQINARLGLEIHGACLQASGLEFDPGNTLAEARTDSHKLSSDHHTPEVKLDDFSFHS